MVKQKNGGKKSVKNTAALGKTNGKVSRNSTSGRGRSRSEPQTIGAKGEEPTLTQRLRQEVYRQSLLPKPPAVQPLKIDLSKAKNRRAERTAKAENPPLGAAALKRGTPTGSENSQNLKDALTSHLSRQFLPVSDFRISSAYGVDRGTHRHSGIDLAVPVGTKVAAAKGGQVSFAGWGNGYGYRVVIDHDDGTQTTYNHLSDIGVKVGDKVRAGSTVALSGNTGNSTGPHLHFEVKADGRYVDPSLYFDFDNGTVAADEGTYTSQMDKAAATGTKSPASNRSGLLRDLPRARLPAAAKAAVPPRKK